MNIVSSQPKLNARIGLIIASILYLLIAVIGTLIAVSSRSLAIQTQANQVE